MTTYSGGKRTIYQINASGGALVAIPATAGSRKVVIQECAPENPPGGGTAWNGGNFAPQGLQYTLPDDGFVQIYPLLPDDPLVIDNPIAQGMGSGRLAGGPAQTDPAGRTIPATIYCKLISATATATQVLCIEYA